MGLIKEFKAFAIKGNVIDLAIGVVIGAAFGKIVTSLIEDVITPLVLSPVMKAAHLKNLSDLTIFGSVKYGSFIAAVVNFFVVAFALFIVIKAVNKMKAKEVKPEPEPTKEELLLTEIRDLLKEKNK